MTKQPHVGVVGTGIYLPKKTRSAAQIAAATNGNWTEDAIIEKQGIREVRVPGEAEGTQEMGAYAAKDALERTGIKPEEVDVILDIGEEWKEYPLTTSSLYVQGAIGAKHAWGIDLQNRCATSLGALKIARDMMIADDEVNTVLIVGGYRNGDFVDYSDPNMSMMYNLSAGAGAMILRKNHGRNAVLGSHFIADGSLARTAGVEIGGTKNPINEDNLKEAYKSLRVMEPETMKARLKEVSVPNWFECIDKSLEKSGKTRSDIDYLAILHIKRSAHDGMVKELGLDDDKTIYLEDYGHMGQIDQILSLHLALQKGKVKDGSTVSLIAAGIGYVWGASVIQWGDIDE